MYNPWVIGLYLAEGCTFVEYRDVASKGQLKGVVFTLGSHDDETVIPALTGYIQSLGHHCTVSPSYTSEHGRRITFSRKDFAEECVQLVGQGALGKTITTQVFDWPVDQRLALI